MDDSLRFRLLFVSEDHVPTYSENYVIPEIRDFQVTLKKNRLNDLPPELVIGGKVVDSKGNPINNAVVDTEAVTIGGRTTSRLDGVDTMAVTNSQGEFRIGLVEPAQIDVQVSSHGFCAQIIEQLKSGELNSIELDRGVTVQGHVHLDGKPMAHVGVGLVQQDRSSDKYVGNFEVDTDDNGFFQFVNVPSNDKFYLYGIMSSLKEHGCVNSIEVTTRENETISDLKPLNVTKGFTLQGRVVFSDGSEVPKGMQAMVSRQRAWDTQQVLIDSDGRFKFEGLPEETYSLVVRRSGYRKSKKNKSLSPINPFRLIGNVDRDLSGIEVLLEPGKTFMMQDFDRDERNQLGRIKKAPITGIE